MIKISFENVESMEPVMLRNVAGMFEVLAQYAEKLSAAIPAPIALTAAFAPMVLSEAGPTLPPAPPVVLAGAATPPPPPPAAHPPGIDVDAAGMPWDGRIHSSSKAKVADGTWRQKRNLDPALLSSVTAELKQTMGLGVAPPPASAGVAPPPFATSAVPPAPPASSIPPAPPIPTPLPSAGVAPTASPSSGNPFLALMKHVTAGFAAKSITQEMINAAVKGVGLPSLPMLVNQPDKIPAVAAALGIAL